MRALSFHGRSGTYLRAGLGGLVLGIAFGWVVYKATGKGFAETGPFPDFIRITLNGLTSAGLYFIIASGFTLIFGLMRIVNMAHGTLYLLGGYIAFSLQEDFSGTSGATTAGFGGGEVQLKDWILPLVLSCLLVGIVGLFIHQVFLRWNQGQELRQALITIALSIIAADQMIAHFGGIAEDIKLPPEFDVDKGLSLGVYDLSYPLYRLIFLAVAVAVGIMLLLVFQKTRFGMIVRAGVDDRNMVSALGINIQLVFAAAFFIGSALAGLGGVLGGTMFALGPGEDQAFLLNSLIVVIIGGMGSLGGAAVGALLLGLVQAYGGAYLVLAGHDYTVYSILVTFALLVFVLAIRPLGLFGRPI